MVMVVAVAQGMSRAWERFTPSAAAEYIDSTHTQNSSEPS